MIFEIMKKENNAAVLTLLTHVNLKTFIGDGIPSHNFKFQKKFFSIVNKRLPFLQFSNL